MQFKVFIQQVNDPKDAAPGAKDKTRQQFLSEDPS